MKKNFLYGYFGNLSPNLLDIPGHFMYQPFLMEEVASRYTDSDYSMDIYSYIEDKDLDISKPVVFSHYFPGINSLMNDWANKHLNSAARGTAEEYCSPYVKLGTVISRIQAGFYDCLFLKARFRNPSTHAKKLYDVKKFENICKLATDNGTPVIIVDTDLSLPDSFIENVINLNDNFRIIGLGNVQKAYPKLDPSRILSSKPLYGISRHMLERVAASFEADPGVFHRKATINALLYYGNIAFSNYKANHTKNREVLEYLIKLAEDLPKMFGVIIGKVEDERFLSHGYFHLARNMRIGISELHQRARLSLNISKALYDATDFSPARITESWIHGIIPLSYSSNPNYQGNPGLVFTNYPELLECVKLYLMDSSIEDYQKYFMQSIHKAIEFRKNEEREDG